MRSLFRALVPVAAALAFAFPSLSPAQSPQADIVINATEVTRGIADMPLRAIPEYLLKDAAGVAVIPAVVKLGFIVGGQRGKGVIVGKRPDGSWSPPVFVTITGGSFGWQAGVQSIDLVLVFRNRRGLDAILRGELTLGADASVAAGPLGRDASAQTSLGLEAEVYSYSQSRGLFAGLAVNGAVIKIDGNATTAYYGGKPLSPRDVIAGTQPLKIPPSGVRFVGEVARLTKP